MNTRPCLGALILGTWSAHGTYLKEGTYLDGLNARLLFILVLPAHAALPLANPRQPEGGTRNPIFVVPWGGTQRDGLSPTGQKKKKANSENKTTTNREIKDNK